MDLNEAALELTRIEIIEKQIIHLRMECDGTTEEYCIDCNNKIQELIKLMLVRSPIDGSIGNSIS